MRAALLATYTTALCRVSVALWLAGVLIAGGTAVDAWARLDALGALPYLAAAAGLAVGAVYTARRATWALLITLIAFGGQFAGVVGSAIQLAVGVDRWKAGELRALGVDPALGVAANLAYSAAAFVVFLLLLLLRRRLLHRRLLHRRP